MPRRQFLPRRNFLFPHSFFLLGNQVHGVVGPLNSQVPLQGVGCILCTLAFGVFSSSTLKSPGLGFTSPVTGRTVPSAPPPPFPFLLLITAEGSLHMCFGSGGSSRRSSVWASPLLGCSMSGHAGPSFISHLTVRAQKNSGHDWWVEIRNTGQHQSGIFTLWPRFTVESDSTIITRTSGTLRLYSELVPSEQVLHLKPQRASFSLEYNSVGKESMRHSLHIAS